MVLSMRGISWKSAKEFCTEKRSLASYFGRQLPGWRYGLQPTESGAVCRSSVTSLGQSWKRKQRRSLRRFLVLRRPQWAAYCLQRSSSPGHNRRKSLILTRLRGHRTKHKIHCAKVPADCPASRSPGVRRSWSAVGLRFGKESLFSVDRPGGVRG